MLGRFGAWNCVEKLAQTPNSYTPIYNAPIVALPRYAKSLYQSGFTYCCGCNAKSRDLSVAILAQGYVLVVVNSAKSCIHLSLTMARESGAPAQPFAYKGQTAPPRATAKAKSGLKASPSLLQLISREKRSVPVVPAVEADGSSSQGMPLTPSFSPLSPHSSSPSTKVWMFRASVVN